MRKSVALQKAYCFLLLLLILNVQSLQNAHQAQEDKQYQRLNQQQTALEDHISDLVEDMTSVQKKVSTTPRAGDKVVLLESAILSEREKVFDIRNQIIPPFSLSKTACEQLTNQQKIDMLDRIKAIKQQLTSLQKQILTAPKCDRISSLQKDTQKQLTLLDSLQKTIYTQCQSKSVLTPTIYQTNVYANGWILGDQDIDDLIEEYYQRNIRYHNITNCPLIKPFYNGQDCMICKDPTPVFNILTRQCTTCPEDQEADSTLRKCGWEPHYTNFSSVDNWAQQGAPMPVPRRQILPCPQQKPYYNGKKCVICLMPKYWSIRQNNCVQCPIEMVFDVNDQRCQKPQTFDLTNLHGTRWVTNDCNLTRIVVDRISVLNLNKTKKYYKICPDDKPYYDGIVCINCPNEFNIDKRKCVSSPNKTSLYDQNERCYVQKETGFETDPRAANYTSKYPLTDTRTPNCKKAKPYYDGIACIYCLDPFPIFNVEKRRCTACDPMEIYNNTQHECIPRDKIYISTYEERLMATPTTSIDDYHAEIGRKITENPGAVVLLCKNPQYSDFIKCLNCSNDEYFNVQRKRCEPCDGVLNSRTKLCSPKTYIYTNLNDNSVKRIVSIPTSVQAENRTINSNLKAHVNAKLCPVQAPYFDNIKCTNCTTKSFNYTSGECIPMVCPDPMYPWYNSTSDACQQCPKNLKYQQNAKKCLPIVYVTNTGAIYYYIEEGSKTKGGLQDQIYSLEKEHAIVSCDASHPYWNGTNCIECAITRNKEDVANFKPYFNLKTLKCQSCSNYDNQTHICKSSCLYPTPVFDPESNTCIPCPAGTYWLSEQSNCGTCPTGVRYNEQTQSCLTWVTNVDQLNNNYIEEGNRTKQNLNNTIENLKRTQKNVNVCPVQTPFFSKSQLKCVLCVNPTPYFNLLTQTCQNCQAYDQKTKTCGTVLPRFKMNVQDWFGTIMG